MAIFPTHATIDSGSDLKQAFAAMGCDTGNLPVAYYDALFEIIEEHASGEEHYELDIIDWDCATTYTVLGEAHITPAMYCAFGEETNTEKLAGYLQGYTTVIWYDESTVYHFAY